MPFDMTGARRWRRRWAVVLAVVAVCLTTAAAVGLAVRPSAALVDGSVSIAMDAPVNSVEGARAVGGAVDIADRDEIAKVWTSDNINAMRSSGYGPIGYRVRTDQAIEAWHWNNHGSWSEPDQRQGYWTSASEVTDDPGVSYAYNLPRRGTTFDQGDHDGYSRLDDGDPTTFWKSNPYLDPHFTGVSDDANPQWIMASFDTPVPVNSVRVEWGTPYALRFRVQYWTGKDALAAGDTGTWQDFPKGTQVGRGGSQEVVVAPTPIPVRQVRLLLLQGSGTPVPGSRGDIRDRLGYAVRELSLGNGAGDFFIDVVGHMASIGQTTMYASSTDPWHRAGDKDTDHEYASLDRLFSSGLTNGQPTLVPVPVLYGVPEDAAALVRYVRARGLPLTQVDLGAQPDRQLAQPEHFAALYLQMATAVTGVDPTLSVGGPGYRTGLPDWSYWPDAAGNRSYTARFLAYLRARNGMDMFDFFAFEWYPFTDVCGDPARPLAQHPRLLADLLTRQERDGLPPSIPKVITGYGYSSVAGQVELDLPGSMINAETVAQFLTLGGTAAYFSGLEPAKITQDEEGKPCNTWGNRMLLQLYDQFESRPLAPFYAFRLLATEWLQPGGRHELYRATAGLVNADKDPLITAYAVRRPDGRLAVMLFNKDPDRSLSVHLQQTAGGRTDPVTGPLDVFQYSSAQWHWYDEKGKGDGGFPERALSPARSVVRSGEVITLPPLSMSVVRTGSLGGHWWSHLPGIG